MGRGGGGGGGGLGGEGEAHLAKDGSRISKRAVAKNLGGGGGEGGLSLVLWWYP